MTTVCAAVHKHCQNRASYPVVNVIQRTDRLLNLHRLMSKENSLMTERVFYKLHATSKQTTITRPFFALTDGWATPADSCLVGKRAKDVVA